MAQFIPSIEKIQQFRVQPTEGEWYLLRFLERTLDDDTVSLSVSERRHKKGTCRFVQVPRSL